MWNDDTRQELKDDKAEEMHRSEQSEPTKTDNSNNDNETENESKGLINQFLIKHKKLRTMLMMH